VFEDLSSDGVSMHVEKDLLDAPLGRGWDLFPDHHWRNAVGR